MTVIIESGYVLPSGDDPMTHARIAHARNWIQGDVSASATATDYFLDAPNNSMTFEKWKSYDDVAVADPTSWTATNCAVSVDALSWALIDGNTWRLTEDSSTGLHFAQYDFPDAIGLLKMVVVCKVKSIGGRSVRLNFRDPSANSYSVDINLATGATIATSSATALVYEIGGGWWNINMTLTPTVTGAGSNLRVTASDGGTVSYLGDGSSGVMFTTPVVARADADWQVTPLVSEEVDYCCIAAHDMGDWGCTLKVQYDDGAGGYTTIISQQITDNSPIYCIFRPKTVGYYRVRINDGNPKIGVVRFGKSMMMERAMYGGITPPILDRGTKLQSNTSETGEFLGRTRIRTDHGASFSWSNITAAWVRSNWSDFQKAVETEPAFIAWRPETFSEASYAQIGKNPQASNTGPRDLMSVSFSARGIAYD